MQFESVTKATLHYLRLYQLLSSPRSIPLKKGATHVSRGDSHNRWENIRAEFATLAVCFPTSSTEGWYLLVVSVKNDVQTPQRIKIIERLTNKRWSVAMYDRKTSEVYGEIRKALAARDLLVRDAPYVELDLSCNG